MKSFAHGLSKSDIADMHGARWFALFEKMDTALSEEQDQLVSATNKLRIQFVVKY